jgi:hypothetical protein
MKKDYSIKIMIAKTLFFAANVLTIAFVFELVINLLKLI